MLFLVCALPCEAKPLIAHFKLKKNLQSTVFPIYSSDAISLVISGVGKIHAAAAASYLYLTQGAPEVAWLNIGVSGHAHFAIGTGFLAHQIIDGGNLKSYYPAFVFEKHSPTAKVITVDQPEVLYATDALYDMEAAGFYATTSRFATVEMIHCYKIISDNRDQSPFRINAKFVEELVQAQLSTLEKIFSALQQISYELTHLQHLPPVYDQCLQNWHFTTTQKHQLQVLLKKMQACCPNSELSVLDDQSLACSRAADLLKYLTHQMHAYPLRF